MSEPEAADKLATQKAMTALKLRASAVPDSKGSQQDQMKTMANSTRRGDGHDSERYGCAKIPLARPLTARDIVRLVQLDVRRRAFRRLARAKQRPGQVDGDGRGGGATADVNGRPSSKVHDAPGRG